MSPKCHKICLFKEPALLRGGGPPLPSCPRSEAIHSLHPRPPGVCERSLEVPGRPVCEAPRGCVFLCSPALIFRQFTRRDLKSSHFIALGALPQANQDSFSLLLEGIYFKLRFHDGWMQLALRWVEESGCTIYSLCLSEDGNDTF